MTREEMWFCIVSSGGLGAYRLRKVLTYFESVEELFAASDARLRALPFLRERDICAFSEMKKKQKYLLEKFEQMLQKGIRFVTMEQPDFPERFINIEDAPVALFVKGELPKDTIASVAIIGARDCTLYGKEMAKHFGDLLARHGIQVISGMALGADASGQWGALNAGGKSFAVLGNGVDICYPKENFPLYMRLQEQGGILSEFLPGTNCRAGFFPMRNRIISALSDGIIVVEAREKSGTMLTVDHALNQGKEVFAVPGRFGDVWSSGCNRLIQQGAGLLMSDEDILSFFGIANAVDETKEVLEKLGTREKQVYATLSVQPKHLDEIIAETQIMPETLLPLLLQMEFCKLVSQPFQGYYTIFTGGRG